MSKYVDKIIHLAIQYENRHCDDKEDRVDFLEELIEELKDRLENLNNNSECGICPEGECDCEEESCL